LAIEQTSGRQRINIHGAVNLETGQTRMIEAETIDAASTIKPLASLEALYPMLAAIHVFLDNARYHHAKLVQDWLAQPGRRIRLHFIPAYCHGRPPQMSPWPLPTLIHLFLLQRGLLVQQAQPQVEISIYLHNPVGVECPYWQA
jgi:hypothetical protein